MATRFLNKVSNTSFVRNYGNAAGWGYLGSKVYVNGDGVARAMAMGYDFGQPWFVDGTNGAATNDGKDPGNALTLIQDAVTAASDGDVIFIAPQAISGSATDPVSYEENIVIPAAKRLALIGAGGGPAQGSQPQLKVGTTTTQAILTIRAAGCLIAGLSINGAGATGGGILLDDDATTKNAFGTIIDSCFFKNCKGTTATDGRTGGAIQWPSVGNSWQVRITNNRFYKNVADIVMKGTTASVPQDVVIQHNIFSGSSGATNATDVNIYIAADGVLGLVIDSNVFPNIPNVGSGSVTDFYDIATGTYGIISNNVFGCTGLTFGGTHTGGTHPATVWLVHNYQQGAVAQEPANEGEIGYTT